MPIPKLTIQGHFRLDGSGCVNTLRLCRGELRAAILFHSLWVSMASEQNLLVSEYLSPFLRGALTMQYVTTISHAVSSNGELVNTRTPGLQDGEFFLCAACSSTLKLITNHNGIKQFVHTLHDNVAIIKAINCPLRPREYKRQMKQATVTGIWFCVLCNRRYKGDKQCPSCEDWTCSRLIEQLPEHANQNGFESFPGTSKEPVWSLF